jgi:hypothetical protein
MLLVGCADNGRWYVWRCADGRDECRRGTEVFGSKDDCEVLAKAAQASQPDVKIFCVKSAPYYGW